MKKSPGLNQERHLQIKHKNKMWTDTRQNSSKQVCVWILMWETTGHALFHWMKSYYGLWILQRFEVKITWWICFLQTHSFKVRSHQTRMKRYAQMIYMLSQCKDAIDNPAALLARMRRRELLNANWAFDAPFVRIAWIARVEKSEFWQIFPLR